MKDQDPTDRLLRRRRDVLDRRTPASACLDAETIAAWASGAVSPDRRTAAEAHAADCSRCLGIVAALARTEPAPEARSWAGWLHVGWLAPATAAAAILLVWVIVDWPAERSRLPERTAEQAAARIEPSAPAVAPEASAPAAGGAREADRRGNALAPRDAAFQAAPSAPPPEPSRSEIPHVSAPPAGTEVRWRSAREHHERAESAAVPAPSRDAPAVVAESAGASRRAEAPVTDTASAAEMPIQIVTPDPAVRWRIAGTVVQRTVDGGGTWQRQEVPADARLLAGSAPAPVVCWIAGASGTLLRTTNGDTWIRLAFPEAVDLVAITATDDQTAAVKAADGRMFRTTDGGRTWTPHETPAAPFP